MAVVSFDYAVGVMRERFEAALADKEGTIDKLCAVVDELRCVLDEPPVSGGCPVLNTAIEFDDTNPVLKEKATAAMNGWLRMKGSIVKEGVARGELSPETDPRYMASVMVVMLEGALMMGKLCDDHGHMERAVTHLKQHLRSLSLPAAG